MVRKYIITGCSGMIFGWVDILQSLIVHKNLPVTLVVSFPL